MFEFVRDAFRHNNRQEIVVGQQPPRDNVIWRNVDDHQRRKKTVRNDRQYFFFRRLEDASILRLQQQQHIEQQLKNEQQQQGFFHILRSQNKSGGEGHAADIRTSVRRQSALLFHPTVRPNRFPHVEERRRVPLRIKMQRISSWFEGRLPLRRRSTARRADAFATAVDGRKQKLKRQPLAENNSGSRLAAAQPRSAEDYRYWLQCAGQPDDHHYADCNLPLWQSAYLPPVKTSKSAAPTSRQSHRLANKADKARTDGSGRKRVASGGSHCAASMDMQTGFNNAYMDDSDSSSDSEDLGYVCESSHFDRLNNNGNNNTNISNLAYSSMRIRGYIQDSSNNNNNNNNGMTYSVTSRNSTRQRIRTNPWISTVDRLHARPQQQYQDHTAEKRVGCNAYVSAAISRSGSGSSSSTAASEPACRCVTSSALSKRLNESTCSAASATSSGYGSADVVSSPECSVHRPDWETAINAKPAPECCGCCCPSASGSSGKSSGTDGCRKNHEDDDGGDDDDVDVRLTGTISPAPTLMGVCRTSFDEQTSSDGTEEHIYHELENADYSYHEAVDQMSCQQCFHSDASCCSTDRDNNNNNKNNKNINSNNHELNNNAYRCESPIYAIPRSRFSADASTIDFNGNNAAQPLARLRPEAVSKRRVTRPQRLVLDWASDATAISSTEEEDNGCGAALLKRHLTPTRQRYFVSTADAEAEADAEADEMSFASSSSSSTSTSCHSWTPMMTIRGDGGTAVPLTMARTTATTESSSKQRVVGENDFIAELDQQIAELQLQSDAVRHLVERAKARHEMRMRTRQLCMEHLRELRKMRWIMHHNFELCL